MRHNLVCVRPSPASAPRRFCYLIVILSNRWIACDYDNKKSRSSVNIVVCDPHSDICLNRRLCVLRLNSWEGEIEQFERHNMQIKTGKLMRKLQQIHCFLLLLTKPRLLRLFRLTCASSQCRRQKCRNCMICSILLSHPFKTHYEIIELENVHNVTKKRM